MTKGYPPLKLEMEGSLPTELPLLPYISAELESDATLEKESTLCYVHGASQTPHLDARLRQPSTQALLHKLSSALANASDEKCCSKCATESAVHTLTTYLSDIRAAKKNGQWSKEEKKGLKTEAKGLMKDIKRDFKSVWKANKEQA